MKTLKNWAFGLCLCGTVGLLGTSLSACGAQGGNTGAVKADTVEADGGNVEREKLEQILECGINAPSGMNQQPWQVRVVDDADYINGLTDIYKKANPKAAEEEGFKNMFRNATAVIFIGSPKNGGGQFDCGLLGENMVLAAQSLGLGTCFLGGPVRFMLDNEECAPYVERLQFPEDYALLYAIAVGYPDESPEAKPRDASKAKFVE